jgi:hypothetical protein
VRVEGDQVDLGLDPLEQVRQGLGQLEETVGFLSSGLLLFCIWKPIEEIGQRLGIQG